MSWGQRRRWGGVLCARLRPSVLITGQNARDARMFDTREAQGGTFSVRGLAVRERGGVIYL